MQKLCNLKCVVILIKFRWKWQSFTMESTPNYYHGQIAERRKSILMCTVRLDTRGSSLIANRILVFWWRRRKKNHCTSYKKRISFNTAYRFFFKQSQNIAFKMTGLIRLNQMLMKKTFSKKERVGRASFDNFANSLI